MVTIRSLRKDRYPVIDDRNSTNICLKPSGRAICHTNEDAVRSYRNSKLRYRCFQPRESSQQDKWI